MTTVYSACNPQAERDRIRIADVKARLGDDVGKAFIFGEPAEPRADQLYPRRAGCTCTVVMISEEKCRCPLVVRFADGFLGIAEREWLAPVAEVS